MKGFSKKSLGKLRCKYFPKNMWKHNLRAHDGGPQMYGSFSESVKKKKSFISSFKMCPVPFVYKQLIFF